MTAPNFLFIITDQHRADYLGCAGHPIVKTPNIDSIAASGTRFTRFHTATPVCMPNRATLLTGRFPSVHGLRQNGEYLTYRANTFADVLSANGYKTATIGKSHIQPMTIHPAEQRIDPAALGLLKEAWKDDGEDYDHETPERYQGNEMYEFPTPYYGYQHVDMVTNHGDQAGGHYEQWLRAQTPKAEYLRDRKNQLKHDYKCPQAVRTAIPEELYSTTFIRDKALKWLDERKNESDPFFAFVSFPDPHHPFTPPGKYWDMYDPKDFDVPAPWGSHKNPIPPMQWLRDQQLAGKRTDQSQEAFTAEPEELREAMALSCGMITMIDDAVGMLIAKLKETGKYDNTVIVFNADHGDYLGHHGLLLKGALPFESITKVPFIWSDPASRKAQASNALASTVDLAPTIMARAGVKPYNGIQGKSLLGNLDGSEQLRERLLMEHQDTFIRMGRSRFMLLRSLLTDRYRITVYRGEGYGELYDLKNDPLESENLWDSAAHKSIRLELMDQLMDEMLENVDTSPHAKRRA